MKYAILVLFLLCKEMTFSQSEPIKNDRESMNDRLRAIVEKRNKETPELHLKDLRFIYANDPEAITNYLKTKRDSATWSNGTTNSWHTQKGNMLNIVKIENTDAAKKFLVLTLYNDYTFQTISGEILRDIDKAGMKQISQDNNAHNFSDGAYTISIRERNDNEQGTLSIVFAKNSFFYSHPYRYPEP